MIVFLNLVIWAVGLFILYLIIKAAVRNGIIEADRLRFGNNLSNEITCFQCSHIYHKDWTSCPICGTKETPDKIRDDE
jgi:rubrerythrin